MFVDKFKGHFNCCILPAGKNTHSDAPPHTHTHTTIQIHTHTHFEQRPDIMGFDVVGALWGVEEQKEEEDY